MGSGVEEQTRTKTSALSSGGRARPTWAEAPVAHTVSGKLPPSRAPGGRPTSPGEQRRRGRWHQGSQPMETQGLGDAGWGWVPRSPQGSSSQRGSRDWNRGCRSEIWGLGLKVNTASIAVLLFSFKLVANVFKIERLAFKSLHLGVQLLVRTGDVSEPRASTSIS